MCSRAPEKKTLTTRFSLLPNYHLWRVSSQLFCLPQMFLLYSRHKVTKLVHLRTSTMTLLSIHFMLARYVEYEITHRKLEVLDNFMKRRCEGVVIRVREDIVNPPVLVKIKSYAH